MQEETLRTLWEFKQHGIFDYLTPLQRQILSKSCNVFRIADPLIDIVEEPDRWLDTFIQAWEYVIVTKEPQQKLVSVYHPLLGTKIGFGMLEIVKFWYYALTDWPQKLRYEAYIRRAEMSILPYWNLPQEIMRNVILF